MDVLVDFARWLCRIRLELWEVVLSALVLAWLAARADGRRQRGYDAWWLANIPRAKGASRLPHPRRRRS